MYSHAYHYTQFSNPQVSQLLPHSTAIAPEQGEHEQWGGFHCNKSRLSISLSRGFTVVPMAKSLTPFSSTSIAAEKLTPKPLKEKSTVSAEITWLAAAILSRFHCCHLRTPPVNTKRWGLCQRKKLFAYVCVLASVYAEKDVGGREFSTLSVGETLNKILM